MKTRARVSFPSLLLSTSIVATAAVAAPAWAEPPAEGSDPGATEAAPVGNPLDKLPWVKDGEGQLGSRAKLKVPEGYRFGEGPTATSILRMMGNIPDGNELGLVGPDDLDWFVVYDFSEIGYVKDDEKDELDADEMLRTFQNGTKQENEARRAQGLATVEILGWAIPPRYDEKANVLEWATKLRFTEPDGSSNIAVNYRTKVLGRKGVMNVILVCGPDELDAVLPAYRTMMEGFTFVDGERYAEFRAGDKVAEYGLAALVVGGATAVAAKAGLFAILLTFFKKAGKLIVVGVVAIGAFFARLFRGGRK